MPADIGPGDSLVGGDSGLAANPGEEDADSTDLPATATESSPNPQSVGLGPGLSPGGLLNYQSLNAIFFKERITGLKVLMIIRSKFRELVNASITKF